MKPIHKTTRALVPVLFLFGAESTWAAEPPKHTLSNNSTVATPATRAEPVSAPTTPVEAEQITPVAAEPKADPVEPLPPSQPANSVDPYGQPEPNPAMMVPPAPAPKKDAPAVLFEPGADYAIGGFGGFGLMYTHLLGKNRPLVCGEAAVIIDHAFTLGGGGCGMPSRMDAQKYGPEPHDSTDRLQFGYGGAIARYHLFSRNVVNLAVGAMVGAGGISIGTRNGLDATDYAGEEDYYASKSQDAVFLFEPQVGGYVNIKRWLRFGAVAGFRIVSGVNTKGMENKDLMGPTLGGQIQGGWF